ncbi:MAG: tetratricopeptide repeat protein [Anaerolineae bacterium]|nr:tetratricopeptide repeat protein [Anaerolineae bacterium]MDW8069980.1 tetratricopeptide repeat protein [Anaerolineae bacterium]
MDTYPEYRRRTRQQLRLGELSPEEAIAQGEAAFARKDYTAAIRLWEQALGALPPEEVRASRLRKALAEAFFRRALSASEAPSDDLTEAVRLAPDEPRYRYHLALVYHRNNIWPSAIALYRGLLERTPPYTRAAFPLAVALLETGHQPQTDAVWQFLSPEEQMCLRAATALVSGRRRRDWQALLSADVHPLWAGLAAFRLKNPQAETCLRTALQDATLPRRAAGVAHYYLGVLAWEDGRQGEAREHWQAAAEAGMRTPWLSDNLAWSYVQSALARLGSENGTALSEALDLAEQGLRAVPDHPVLRRIVEHMREHLGYRAAQSGDWKTARKHLGAIYQAGRRGHALLTNLALTAEALGQYAMAGRLWQQLARTRPRKASAEGFMSDDQVARVWRRAAQCFSRAGDYREAARLYQNALRYTPHDVDLQLERVAALFQSEQYTPALSAVSDLLTQHPEHKEALAWKAHLLEKVAHPYSALASWQHVLQLDPNHPTARQHIAQLSCELGDRLLERNDLRHAFTMYHQGLEVAPQDARLRAAVIRFYGLLGDMERASEDTERLLRERPDDLEVYYWLLRTWVSLDKDDAVQEYLRHVEALHPPVSFYIVLAIECIRNRAHRWANRFAGIAQRHPALNARELFDLAHIYAFIGESQQVVKCLERAVALAPDMAEAHLLLGMHLLSRTQAQARQRAKEHLLQAERLAQQKRNVAVAMQARGVLSTLS